MRKALVIAILLLAVPGLALAKQQHSKRRAVAKPQPQIACTVIGCVEVPPGCGQTPGRTFDGSPTGGDVIVCPPGVAPFR